MMSKQSNNASDYFTEQELLDMGFLISRNYDDVIRCLGRGINLLDGFPIIVGNMRLYDTASPNRAYYGYILISDKSIEYGSVTRYGDPVEVSNATNFECMIMKYAWDSPRNTTVNNVECNNDYSLLNVQITHHDANNATAIILDNSLEFVSKLVRSCKHLV